MFSCILFYIIFDTGNVNTSMSNAINNYNTNINTEKDTLNTIWTECDELSADVNVINGMVPTFKKVHLLFRIIYYGIIYS